MRLKYKAIDHHGSLLAGELETASIEELERHLERMDLDLVSYRPVRQRKSKHSTISRKDLIAFCIHMEQLLRAGVPVMQGLDDLRIGASNPALRSALAAIITDIEGGKTLSQALSAQPSIFDEVFIALIRAGEATGQLPAAFQNLSDSIKWQDEIIAQTKKALLYPGFVLIMVTAAVSFLMIYLMPQLVEFIQNISGQMPIHTRALIATSYFFVDYWYLIFGLPALAGLIYSSSYRPGSSFQLKADKAKLKIWFIGSILEKIALARFANFFALTYRAGLTIPDCIQICQAAVDNAWLRHGLTEAGQLLAQGESISKSFEKTNLFPLLVLRMLKVGENTGGLDEALMNVSYFYDRDVKEAIGKMQALIEPVLTIVLGIMLGWVMLAVLAPIYDSLGGLGA